MTQVLTKDYEEITKVLTKYTDGNKYADSKLMSQAFHPQATIYGYDGETLFGPEIKKLYELIDGFPQSPEAVAFISRVEVVGNAASARVDSENVAGVGFTDFFNLLKIDGSWIIVNKIYFTHPK